MLAYLLSRPPGWQVNFSDIVNQRDAGKDKCRKVFNELIKCGYVRSEERRDERGRMNGRDYFVYDTPQSQEKKAENPFPEKPEADNPDHIKDRKILNTESISGEAEFRLLPEPERKPTVDEEFENEFWPVVARKVGKPSALRAYRAARKKAGKDEIIGGMKAYAAECSAKGTESGFIKHPQGWLNDERWTTHQSEPRRRPPGIDFDPEAVKAEVRAKFNAVPAGAS